LAVRAFERGAQALYGFRRAGSRLCSSEHQQQLGVVRRPGLPQRARKVANGHRRHATGARLIRSFYQPRDDPPIPQWIDL